MLLLFTATAFACEVVDVDAVLAKVDASIEEDAPERGLSAMRMAWDALPQSCGPVAGADLPRLAWRAAGHAYRLGLVDDARQWAVRACAVGPASTPPAALAGSGFDTCARLGAGAMGQARVASPARVDGADHAVGAELSLPVGEHLVQWEEGGSWRGRFVALTAGKALELPSGNAGVASLPKAPEPAVEAPATAPSRSLAAPIALTATGAGLMVAGGVVFQALWADAYNESCRRQYRAADWAQCEEELGVELSPGYYGGIGLLGAGGVLAATGLGIGMSALLTADAAALQVHGNF